MPWQSEVLEVALEVDPKTRQLAYRDVLVTCPRQQGKTSLLLVLLLARALAKGRQRCNYTAQSGADARSKLERDWLPLLTASPLVPYLSARMANGREALACSNGSLITLVSNSRRAGHGQVVDLVVMDEAFAAQDARLEQALRPAQVTRPSSQFWIVSTAGTPHDSPYLWSKVAHGREVASAGTTTGLCYFEWSADDDEAPGDPETWRKCMPALAITIDEASVAADLASMPRSEFERAYLNRWVTIKAEQVIPPEIWASLEDQSSKPVGPLSYAVDVPPDRTSAAIAMAGHREDGLAHIEVTDLDRGTDWVVETMATILRREHDRPVVVLDPSGPAGSLLPELQRRGIEVVTTGPRDMAQACGAFYDAAIGHKLRFAGPRELTTALEGAAKRPLGDAWAWSRKTSGANIAPLVACTLALWGLESQTHPAPGVWSLDEAVERLLARQAGESPETSAESEPKNPFGQRFVPLSEMPRYESWRIR
jgi:hypothetical protein